MRLHQTLQRNVGLEILLLALVFLFIKKRSGITRLYGSYNTGVKCVVDEKIPVLSQMVIEDVKEFPEITEHPVSMLQYANNRNSIYMAF